MVVVCIVGYTASGKTELGMDLVERKVYLNSCVEVSDLVKEVSKDGTDVIGNEDLHQRILGEIEDGSVVTGIRELDLLNLVIKKFPDTIIIKVVSSENLRFTRFMKDRNKTEEDFYKKDIQERKIGLPKLMNSNIGRFLQNQLHWNKEDFGCVKSEAAIIVDCESRKE